jgi:hypothetical protein
MAFEVFDKRTSGITKSPFVTIQKGGYFSLNKAAVHAMGDPEAVELLFDPSENLIGFRPVPSTNPRSFPVRLMGQNASTYMISGGAFTRHYDIDSTESRRYGVEMKDGILILDLKGESVNVSTRPRRNKSS